MIDGLWVLLLSIAALRDDSFSKPLNYLGCLVGLAGITTVYPAEVLTMVFGLSQIAWFVWLGFVMFKSIR